MKIMIRFKDGKRGVVDLDALIYQVTVRLVWFFLGVGFVFLGMILGGINV